MTTGKATVITDTDRIDIEVKPLTIICHQGTVNIKDIIPADGGPPIIEIGPDHTIEVVAMMKASTYLFWRGIPWVVEEWTKIVGSEGRFHGKGVEFPETIEAMRASSLASRHVFGLITRVAEVVVGGFRPFLRLPESYLHPSQQVAIAQFLVRLSNRGGSDADAEKK